MAHITGFKRKFPILINLWLKIFAFPTLSPEQFECI
ncbi:competence protein ComK [Bacillus litorisediminis]